jgi:alpha-ketoglutaric semialdehyde dehydrogenase
MGTARFQSLVGGEWLRTGDEAVVENPSDLDSPVGVALQAAPELVDAAVDAARDGGERWRSQTGAGRAEALERVAAELLARSDELGRLLASEEGKTLAEARGEVARAGQIFRFFAGEAVRLGGEVVESVRPGVEVELRHEPLGIVAAITPWNFPIAIPAWKTAPALAYGNSVILKPAELVPASAAALADVVQRAGVPAGAFNLVVGSGRRIGDAIVGHPGIDAVTFTGSVDVGGRVRELAAGRGARVQLEMGGKNPLVVLDDADLGVAVDCAVQGAFGSTGQRCTASSRLIVGAAIHDAFVEALVEAMGRLRVGHALAEDTDIGPVVDRRQLDQDLEYLQIGRDEGAELAVGGELVENPGSRGWYLHPAVFVGARNEMRICREEIFGPVAAVIRADGYEQALAIANDTPFGLSAGICTRSLAHAADFKRRAQAGMVMVNLPTAGVDFHVGFGGRKGSSYGPREQGAQAREFFTQHKTVYTSPGAV